ncbi:MAG: large conductance mechanosensitive channel protein MscL [Acidimicrobiia bacterium]
MKDLKDFLTRGNVVGLAVAVIIAVAFGAVVLSFTQDILMQIIGGIFGQPDFSDLTLEIGDIVIFYGRFLNALINFLIIGMTMFFVVKGYEKVFPPKEAGATEVDVLEEIRDLLKSQRPST